MRQTAAAILVMALTGVASAQTTAGRDSEDAVALTRGLYATASYAEALTAIARLKASAPQERRSDLERYEALCLLALGRSDEAERVMAALVTRDPLYRFDPADAPSGVAAFSSVRQRVLPGVARRLYDEGKHAYDRRALGRAIAALTRALQVIAEPDAESDGIDDLQMLAAGFIDLSRAALAAEAPLPASSLGAAVCSVTRG